MIDLWVLDLLCSLDRNSKQYDALLRYLKLDCEGYLIPISHMHEDEIKLLPKIVFEKIRGEISFVWSKLPNVIKSDPVFKKYKPCTRHPDMREIVADHPHDRLLVSNCKFCIKERKDMLRHEFFRLQTFKNWPTNTYVSSGELAKNGFVYTNVRDCVECNFCDVGLHNFQVGDIVHEEHKHFSPNCPFVCNEDVGNILL